MVARGQGTDPAIRIEDLRSILGPREFESEVAATVPVPGVVTGLAVTPAGGEILFIEASKMPGTGRLALTGQLGDVMRESAQAAISIIRSRKGKWRVKSDDFGKVDLHIHIPAGATPKDGPSAGVALLTAATSVLLNRPVDPAIGMTGEITLSGRVLPVGGIREKVIAAHRAGLSTIILPERNLPHLEEIPADIRDQIQFVPARTIDDVLSFVFGVKKDPALAKAAQEHAARNGAVRKRRTRTTDHRPTHNPGKTRRRARPSSRR
jgi:ATP-dependent Lon protease